MTDPILTPARDVSRIPWLSLGDLVVIVGIWTPALLLDGLTPELIALGVTTHMVLMTSSGVSWRLAASLDSINRRRMVDAALWTTLVLFIVASWAHDVTNRTAAALVLGATGSVLAMIVWRHMAQRLRPVRGPDRDPDPVLLVGDHREAHELLDLVEAHPETRWRVVGWVDGSDEDPIPRAARRLGASTVLVAPSALRRDHVTASLTELRDRGIRVHLDTGLRGCDRRRVSLSRLGTEPMLVLEPRRLARVQRALKRALDIVIAFLALLVSAPILLLAAVAIRIEDRGPVLFRQRRVGRHGIPFALAKLRTMQVGAEDRLDEIAHLNERRDGPLFKVDHDPRVTRVGRLLRATSIDELPQLWHVLRGQMSLVGPRPALPEEVRHFDDRLLARHRVRPGVTGVWQVHHRDDASFDTYRRSDLFYLANWSMGLDLGILARTIPTVMGRGWRSLRHRPAPTPEPVAS